MLVTDAGIDWLMCLISIASAAVANVPRVLRQIWPHLAVLGLFAAFVTWNGGVVLGMSKLFPPFSNLMLTISQATSPTMLPRSI